MEMKVMTMKMPAIRAVLLSEPVSRSRVADADPFGDDDMVGSCGWNIGWADLVDRACESQDRELMRARLWGAGCISGDAICRWGLACIPSADVVSDRGLANHWREMFRC
jgi:hypothetical protein